MTLRKRSGYPILAMWQRCHPQTKVAYHKCWEMDRKLSEQQYRLDSQPSIAPTPEIQRQLSLDDGQWQLLSH
jgi:hypothetical protein